MTDHVGLTALQFRCLTFIDDTIAETGVAPSFEDMMARLGMKSKSEVHRLVTALEERGYIRRIAGRARAIQVLRLPRSVGVSRLLIEGLPLPDLFKLKSTLEEQIRLKLEAA